MQQETRGHRNWQTTTILFVLGLLIVLRLLLSSRLPAYILADMPHDDGWVVSRALYILKGQWLGPYDQYTLIKGAFSPLLMAFSARLGVTFSFLNTILYCLACVVFVVSVRPLIKSNWLQLMLFALLLFNPVSYALETSQRIYRNGIGQWQILVIFGCLIAVFLRRHESWKSLLKWVLLCGLTLGAFLQTREDGTWIYPFVLGTIIVTIVVFLLEKNGSKTKIVLYVLPMVIAWSLYGTTAIVNYKRYGAPVVNDRGGGNYAKVAADLHAITPNADGERLYESDAYKDRYYNIYVSTMEKAFAASPTMNSAVQPIREAIRIWASWEDDKNGEVSTDHMLFALRDGVKAAGYYRSLPETEKFYGKIHEELQTAFRNGTLVKRGFPISPLIKRVKIQDIGKALSLMPGAIRGIAGFSDVDSRAVASVGSAVGIRNVHLLAGGEYFTSRGTLSGSGWAFAEDDKVRASAGVYGKNDVIIATLPFQSGEDVFRALKFENAKMSRFSFAIDGYDLKSGVSLRFFDQSGNLIWQIPVNTETPADGPICGGALGSFRYCIDRLRSESSPEEFYAQFVARANRVGRAYQTLMPGISLLACLAYLVSTIFLIREVRRKQNLKTLPVWLVLTGLASTFILFVLAMCTIAATSFNALTYLYTAPANLLLLMFCGVSVCWGAGALLAFGKRGFP